MRVEMQMGADEIQVLAAAVAAAALESLAPKLAALESAIRMALESGQGKTQPMTGGRAVAIEPAVISRKQVMRLTGLSETTLWRLEDRGDFPARVQLGARRIGWRVSDVDAWLESRRVA